MIDVEDFRRMKRRLMRAEQHGIDCEYEIKVLTAIIEAVEKDRMDWCLLRINKSPVIATMGDDGKWRPPEKEKKHE